MLKQPLQLCAMALLTAALLTACQKQEEKTQAEPSAPSQVAASSEQNAADMDHDGDDHEAHSEEDGHDHSAHDHDHEHDAGEAYQCDNGKTIHIEEHDHEGEKMAHATIDDIEYDMVQEDGESRYTAPTESFATGQTGMALSLEGDKATFSSLDGATVLTSCQKS